MNAPRLLQPNALERLKSATFAALQATPEGSAAGFAARTRVEGRSLRKYADHHHDMYAPIDIAVELDVASRRPIIASVMADLVGFTLAPKRIDAAGSALKAIKETGEATAAIAAIAGSGAWGHDEAKAALSEVRDALAALAALEGALINRLEGKS